MTLDALCDASILDLSAHLQKRVVSATELVRAYLTRIDRIDALLHAYITVQADAALEQARAVDEAIGRGDYRGALHGIPLALKDVIEVAGVRTTAASRLLRDHVSREDAVVVAHLRRAGAVILGKSTMYEFAIGLPHSTDAFPAARNPWNASVETGGSSSGSAVAVIAGLCAGSFGSDTGGSIRHPAAHTGVVGLKPTHDLVSRGGVIPLAWSLDDVGPLGRCVADVALLLGAVINRPLHLPDQRFEDLRGMTVGVPWSLIRSAPGLQDEVLSAFQGAVEMLGHLGAAVVEVTIDWIEHAGAILTAILLGEAAAYHAPWLRRRGNEYGRGFRERIIPAMLLTAVDYIQAQHGRERLAAAVSRVMTMVDVLVTPTMSRTARVIDEAAPASPWSAPVFTRLHNLTGQPSISVPCGFDRRGLPIGLMIAGRPLEDEKVLAVAAAYERAAKWRVRLLSGSGNK